MAEPHSRICISNMFPADAAAAAAGLRTEPANHWVPVHKMGAGVE